MVYKDRVEKYCWKSGSRIMYYDEILKKEKEDVDGLLLVLVSEDMHWGYAMRRCNEKV